MVAIRVGLLLLSVKCVICVNPSSVFPPLEYYWREYTGSIPSDALPGGKDVDGHDTYIGQAYIHSHGIFVAQIFPGKTEVDLACYGVKKATSDIKILCTRKPKNFQWISTSNKFFHINMTEKSPIQGGYNFVENKGLLHIGRLMYQGVLKIGPIPSYDLENTIFYFPHNNVERGANFYQVLVYQGLSNTN